MLINYKNKKIFAFSDTHGMNNRLEIPEDVDILICCGDCTRDIMSDEEIISFLKWYSQLPGRYKLFVPGNHDMLFETEPERAKLYFPMSVTLLEDSGVKIEDIYFFGVSTRPWRFKNSEYDLPKGVDFLITHAPAKGHLDNNTGCEILKDMIDKGKPKYHIFGHLHDLGLQQEFTPETTYINVSYYNQLLYHYTKHESLELEISAIRDIEEEIIISFNHSRHYENEKSLLEIRRHLINEMVLAHQENIIEPIREFNDCLMEALKELYERAKRIYDDLKVHSDYGDEIDVTASLYLDNDYPKLHPIQGDDRQDLWEAICDGGWNVLYDEGISFYIGRNESFESLTGMDSPLPNWNDGLDPEVTKDMHLCIQFHHLFDHTKFAITDFIYVRKFWSEIKIVIDKDRV